MSDYSDLEFDRSGLRYEWLNRLNKEDLKLLCLNRSIEIGIDREIVIKSLLRSQSKHNDDDDEDWTQRKREVLSIELRAKGIAHSMNATKSELVQLFTKNKKIKQTKSSLKRLKASELQTLCRRRGVETKAVSTKKRCIELLEGDDAYYEPEITGSWTSKQLMAELRGRGLTVGKLKKEEMIEMLSSRICREEQKLESNLKNIDRITKNTRQSLVEFMQFIRENKENIRKNTKHNTRTNANMKSPWTKMIDALITAKEEIMGMIAFCCFIKNLYFQCAQK